MLGGSASQGGPMGMLKSLGGQESGRIDHRIIFRLLAFVKPYRFQLFLAGLLMLLAAAATLLIPYLLKVIIDKYLVSKDRGPFLITSAILLGVMLINYGAA